MADPASQPTLTLAICARRAEHIIGDSLDSIADQTEPPDEVLVAIDEDDDPTGDVAREHGARVIVTHARGLYEARNAVLDACTTDYLAFTDADCALVPEWVECVKRVFAHHPDVAAGTGRHPAIGERTLASWLHHMWFVVETRETGEVDGVIGGNSYFRTAALRDVGGWLHLPGHSAAEDVYISLALREAGHRIWFERRAAARHNYETRLRGLWRKSVMMGRDIVVMMRAAGRRGTLWWYTLGIPVAAALFLAGLALMAWSPVAGAALAAFPLAVTFGLLLRNFGCLRKAFPRWVARWVVIWPYSWGILKGLVIPLPEGAGKRE